MIWLWKNDTKIHWSISSYLIPAQPVTPISTYPKHIIEIKVPSLVHLQAARSRSSCTRMVPDIIKPRPNPGNMYALLACDEQTKKTSKLDLILHVRFLTVIQILRGFKTWPGTNSFPSYSTGANGLPLAKMARPW